MYLVVSTCACLMCPPFQACRGRPSLGREAPERGAALALWQAGWVACSSRNLVWPRPRGLLRDSGKDGGPKSLGLGRPLWSPRFGYPPARGRGSSPTSGVETRAVRDTATPGTWCQLGPRKSRAAVALGLAQRPCSHIPLPQASDPGGPRLVGWRRLVFVREYLSHPQYCQVTLSPRRPTVKT